MRKATFLLFLTIFISSSFLGQKNHQPELDSGSIESQFDYIITKSSGYKEFQLIRKKSILKVKAHALDSLKNMRTELINAKESIPPLQANINNLESEVLTLKNEIESIGQDKESISLLGIALTKSSYNTIVWSVIIVLVLGLLFFMFQYKNNRSTSKNSKRELDKIENELETLRKKALKKEQELMRKLQDEINKNNP